MNNYVKFKGEPKALANPQNAMEERMSNKESGVQKGRDLYKSMHPTKKEN